MPDKVDKLRATLADLHAELAALEGSDPEVQALLESAVAELRSAVEQHGPTLAQGLDSQSGTSILERLRAAVRHYQDSHPAMSASVGSVIDVLGRMGL